MFSCVMLDGAFGISTRSCNASSKFELGCNVIPCPYTAGADVESLTRGHQDGQETISKQAEI